MGLFQMMISFSLSTELGLWFLEFARSIERVDESIRSVLASQRSILLRNDENEAEFECERDLYLKQKAHSFVDEDSREGDLSVDRDFS
ncbi:hypothetical protein AAC387_Pa02g4955 [Persea americana]